MTSVSNRVVQYIERHGLLKASGKYIVALSGGADSVALLLLLRTLGYCVEAAHCNFHLRGAESDRDENFVKNLCDRHDVPLHLVHFDTKEYASLHKVSIEMAARNLRYAWFNQLASDIHADGICVAHHRNDSVETLLINLLRGTGIHGLTGIRPLNGNIIRPLLCLSRAEIEQYLHSIGQDYITDSTNLVDDVVRNKIRLNIMPLLREINPSADECIQQTAERISDAIAVYDNAIEASVKRVSYSKDNCLHIDISKLIAEPSPECALFKMLSSFGFSPLQIENISSNLYLPTGSIFSSSNYDLLFDRGEIVVCEKHAPMKPFKIPEPGIYVSGGTRWRVQQVPVDDTFTISRDSDVATIDASRVKFPLTIRGVDNGDRFIPFGMKGSKLVSDYLTDRKRSVFEKKSKLVVADSEGDILWLVGERTDNRFRIDDNSKEALILSFERQ